MEATRYFAPDDKGVAMADILLTADRSLMNDFHLNWDISQFFYGQGESLPGWYMAIAGQGPSLEDGRVRFAPYPLRKVEARILDLGHDVSVISPRQIPKMVPGAKVLGIHTVNPLGLATAVYLTQFLGKGQKGAAHHFRELLRSEAIRKARRDGLKVIIGGQGAWQLERTPAMMDELGIDCVIVGEAELVIEDVLLNALDGRPLPRVVRVGPEQTPDIDQIPKIRHPSSGGCIEIGRGCPRHCKFCEVSKPMLRWYPLEKIERELRVNAQGGMTHGMLHAEDVFLYGQRSVVPKKERVLDLVRLAQRYYEAFHLTHVSIASSLAAPRMIEDFMELVLRKQDFMLVEIGLETGSPRLLGKLMRSKVRPFCPERWVELIHEALGRMHDSMLMPICSIIFGLPEETVSDRERTLALVDGLKDYRCILFPVNFVPLGSLNENEAQSRTLRDLNRLESEILFKCVEHDFKWVKKSLRRLLNRSRYRFFIDILVRLWMAQFRKRAARCRKETRYDGADELEKGQELVRAVGYD